MRCKLYTVIFDDDDSDNDDDDEGVGYFFKQDTVFNASTLKYEYWPQSSESENWTFLYQKITIELSVYRTEFILITDLNYNI
jgi:hypothetical protein